MRHVPEQYKVGVRVRDHLYGTVHLGTVQSVTITRVYVRFDEPTGYGQELMYDVPHLQFLEIVKP